MKFPKLFISVVILTISIFLGACSKGDSSSADGSGFTGKSFVGTWMIANTSDPDHKPDERVDYVAYFIDSNLRVTIEAFGLFDPAQKTQLQSILYGQLNLTSENEGFLIFSKETLDFIRQKSASEYEAMLKLNIKLKFNPSNGLVGMTHEDPTKEKPQPKNGTTIDSTFYLVKVTPEYLQKAKETSRQHIVSLEEQKSILQPQLENSKFVLESKIDVWVDIKNGKESRRSTPASMLPEEKEYKLDDGSVLKIITVKIFEISPSGKAFVNGKLDADWKIRLNRGEKQARLSLLKKEESWWHELVGGFIEMTTEGLIIINKSSYDSTAESYSIYNYKRVSK